MRAGKYAIFDGVEHRARVLEASVALLLPRVGPCPEGWAPGSMEYWIRRVPRVSVARLVSVTTFYTFHGIRVAVHDIHPTTETAWISYTRGSETTPRHPAFTPDPDPGVAQWTADVPWSSLTDVHETIAEIPVVPPNPYS